METPVDSSLASTEDILVAVWYLVFSSLLFSCNSEISEESLLIFLTEPFYTISQGDKYYKQGTAVDNKSQILAHQSIDGDFRMLFLTHVPLLSFLLFSTWHFWL